MSATASAGRHTTSAPFVSAPRRLNCSLKPCEASIRFLFQLALPDAYHSPTSAAQSRGYTSVTCFIATYFVSPSVGVGLWLDVLAAVVSVPEATVDKNCDLELGPREVGAPNQRLMPAPAGKPRFAKQFDQSFFGRLISRAFHARHQPSASQLPKSCSLFSCVPGPSAHRRTPPRRQPCFRTANNSSLPASFAYSGGTALPIMLHAASIWSVTKR